ncbi:NADH-ubiquinone oxidoreductase-F iron-sulfur binding region domain-containing protein [Haloarcula salina]|uniref:NADH-ubiquinone oxidoreductase-F iron-sulfur binding region domain-containing protein n=1 Tax=Haloarcula salina TaxID=1429914 RepID=UPI003C6EDFD9
MTRITATDGTTIRISSAGPSRALRNRATDVDAAVVEVGSTGLPAIEPLVAVTRAGETAFHARCSPMEMDAIAASLDEEAVSTAGDAVAQHDPDATRLPAVDLPGLRGSDRVILGACGWRRPTEPEDHEAAGGFTDPDATAVLEAAADLRGRGWGDLCHDEPLAATWKTARDADDDPVVVVNAHGNTTDTLLLSSAPFEVLDGAVAAARAVGAESVVVYTSVDDDRAVETVREAAANYPSPAPAVDVVTGPAEYRAAEPTMALEAIEGNHRLEARIRPPGPESTGLHGRPTLVHTPRTLAHLAVSLRTGRQPDTRTVTLTGDVADPATVEVSESETLETALDAVDIDGEFKAACVGGRFGGLTRDADVALDPATLTEAGLGTEGTVHVLAEDRCVLEFVGKRTQFAADENCGRCVPCREGTTQLADLLRDIYDGEYAPGDIEELARVMDTSSICAFGVQAGRPARTALTEFESELRAHADGRCPTSSCLDAVEVT